MTNEYPNPNDKRYDLEERTARFGEAVIDFAQSINKNFVASPLTSQLVRAETSVGANYMEADGAATKKDFRNKKRYAERKPKRPATGFE